MRLASHELPTLAPPRAPSAALLSGLWAALFAAAVLGGWAFAHGWTEAKLATRAAPPPGFTFSETAHRTNADGQPVRFGMLVDDADPVSHRAAAQVGDRWLELNGEGFEGGSFERLLVSPDGLRWLALEAFDTEAPGDLQLIASDDGGRTFVHRSTVPWPSYAAYLEDVRFDGEHVEVYLAVDEAVQLAQPYWSPLDELLTRLRPADDDALPMLAPGHYLLRSGSAGRWFGRLVRVG